MPERPEDANDPDVTDDMQSPLSPAEDARIQRLLAEARHTEPMPAHVVARFEGVLADLHARRTDERPAPVVDLASRRRRTAASLLVAAAAVVVAGVGLGQILPNGANDAGPSASADQSVQEQEMAGGDAGAGEAKRSDTPNSQSAPEAEAPTDGGMLLGEVQIRSGHFGTDVREARKALARAQPDAITEFGAPASTCASGITGDGTVVAATYDGGAAALVLRPAAGDVQVVDLYLCEATEPLRSITLTVP